MGRFMRWLKQLLTGRKQGRKGLEESHVASDWNDGQEKEKKRWSFVKQRKSGAGDGGRPSDQAAAAAAAAETPQAKSFRCYEEEDVRGREETAAVLIQKTFRGYLARKALRALRSLVKIQALVRGYLVRKQTAMTLRKLQTLIRLQADSIAVKKASYRKSVEQEVRILEQEIRLKMPAMPVHRRRLSDSTDSNYERSPRIVEMDTCHLRSRSSRMAGRYTAPDHSTAEYLRHAPSCSPLPGKLQPARLSFRRSGGHDRDNTRGSKTAHGTPRFFVPAQPYDSPAKSAVEYGGLSLASTTPQRTPQHRDSALAGSPRYMAGTASSAARTRCHSAPRQRQQQQAAEAARTSLTTTRAAGSRRSCPHASYGGFCPHCFDASRRTGGGYELRIDDEAARDYYLDSLW